MFLALLALSCTKNKDGLRVVEREMRAKHYVGDRHRSAVVQPRGKARLSVGQDEHVDYKEDRQDRQDRQDRHAGEGENGNRSAEHSGQATQTDEDSDTEASVYDERTVEAQEEMDAKRVHQSLRRRHNCLLCTTMTFAATTAMLLYALMAHASISGSMHGCASCLHLVWH